MKENENQGDVFSHSQLSLFNLIQGQTVLLVTINMTIKRPQLPYILECSGEQIYIYMYNMKPRDVSNDVNVSVYMYMYSESPGFQ